MKNLKKWTAAITVCTLLMPCFGAMNVYAKYTAPTVRTVDFNSLPEGPADAAAAKGGWNDLILSQGQQGQPNSSYCYDVVDGVFGKEKGDKALCIYNDRFVTEAAGTDPMQKARFADTADGGRNGFDNRIELNKGEYMELSFDLAIDGETGEKNIRGVYNTGDSWTWTAYDFLKIKNQELYLFGNKIADVTIAPKSWYNYRFVFRSGDDDAENTEDKNYYRFYVDNRLLSEGSFTPLNDKGNVVTKTFKGFSEIWFTQQAFDGGVLSKAQQNKERDLYVDNIIITADTEKPAEKLEKKTLTFNSIGEKSDAAAEVVSNIGYWNRAALREGDANAEYAVKGGLYGRDTDDYSLDMCNKGKDPINASRDPNQYYEIGDNLCSKHNINKNEKTIISADKGDYYEIEYYMAFDGAGKKELTGFYDGIIEGFTGWTQGKSIPIISVDGGGNVKAFNEGVSGVKLNEHKWYKFNVVINVQDGEKAAELEKQNSYKLYIDNKLVHDSAFTPELDNAALRGKLKDPFCGYYSFWLTNFNNTENTTHVYYDDFTVTNHKNIEPVYSDYSFVPGDEIAANYSDGGLYFNVDERVKSEAAKPWIIKAADGIELAKAEIADSNGRQLADGTALLQKNNGEKTEYFARAKYQDGSALYATLVNDYSAIKDVSFAAAADGTPCNEFVYSLKDCTTEKYHSGEAGKKADDYYLKLDTADEKQSLYDSFVQLDPSVLNGWNRSGAYHVETLLRFDGDYSYCKFIAIGTLNNAKDWKSVISFRDDGDILDYTGAVIGGYRKGQWINLGVSFYPESNRVEVRLDGKTVFTKQLFDVDGDIVSRFKIEQAFDGASEENPKSGSMSIDNFKVYQGSLADASYNGINISSSEYTVYNNGKLTVIPDEYAESTEFYSNLGNLPQNPNVCVFTDDTLTEMNGALDDITDGNVLMISDGRCYNYYKIVSEGFKAAEVVSVKDSENRNVSSSVGKKTVVPQVRVFKETPQMTVVIGQYDKNGSLISVGMTAIAPHIPGQSALTDEFAYPSCSAGNIDFDVKDSADSTFKAYIWDENMQPITGTYPVK